MSKDRILRRRSIIHRYYFLLTRSTLAFSRNYSQHLLRHRGPSPSLLRQSLQYQSRRTTVYSLQTVYYRITVYLLIQQSLGLKLSTRLKAYRSCKTASFYTITSSILLRTLLYQECRSVQLLSTRLTINYSQDTLVEPSYDSSCNYAITSLIQAKTLTSTMLITIPIGVYTCLETRSQACYTRYQYLNDYNSTLQSTLSTVQRVRQVIT